MLWVKAFHIIFMVTWFAGLFYLPRLFVYHADCHDRPGHERFLVMERKLYAIMTIGGILTVAFGLWLIAGWHWPLTEGWLHAKLALVGLLILYHLYCGRLVKSFRSGNNRHSGVFYRWFNEFPALILVAVVLLAVLRPF
ncbi:MAG TPA: protoporphyrinogen oxidase HemJ [Gammaproteobacteria bacterium]|nr:protoporphyrinogen oxidase HemJ [Gammaproteobacteria bacterium]